MGLILTFIILSLDNIYENLGVIWYYFIMEKMGNLLKKITDPMAIMIRVAELMARYFWFLWEFVGFLYFF